MKSGVGFGPPQTSGLSGVGSSSPAQTQGSDDNKKVQKGLLQEIQNEFVGAANTPDITGPTNAGLGQSSSDLDPSSSAQVASALDLMGQMGAQARQTGAMPANAQTLLQNALSGLNPAQQKSLYGILALSRDQTQAQGLVPTPQTAGVDASAQVASLGQSAPAAPVASGGSAQLLQDAQQLFGDQKYKEAHDKFAEALKEDPSLKTTWPSIFYNMGVAAEYSGDDSLLQEAQADYQTFLAAPGIDATAKAWVQNELKGGLASQIALQGANAAFQKNDYDNAYKGYQAALQADPTLATRWPTISYQLGVSCEYSSNASLNDQALGFYQKFLASPNPDPQSATWVKGEVQWLKDKPDATAMIQSAQDQLYKENRAGNAFSILKDALDKYPELGERQPDAYYSLALYAYSGSDVVGAQKYLDIAKEAMDKQLKSDPKSQYANYYMQQIDALQGQISDPIGNWPTAAASFMGDVFGDKTRRFWQQIFQGASTVWMNKGRLWSYDNKAWESKQIGVHGEGDIKDLRNMSWTKVRTDTAKQKEEFDSVNAQLTELRQSAIKNKAELAELEAKKKTLSDKLDKAVAANEDVTKLNKQISEVNEDIAHATAQAQHDASAISTLESNRDELTKRFAFDADPTRDARVDPEGEHRLLPEERQELDHCDREVRESKQKVNGLEGSLIAGQKELSDLRRELKGATGSKKEKLEEQIKAAAEQIDRTQSELDKAKTSLTNAEHIRTDVIEAIKLGPAAAARQILDVAAATLEGAIAERDRVKQELDNTSITEVTKRAQLKNELAAFEEHVTQDKKALIDAKFRAAQLEQSLSDVRVPGRELSTVEKAELTRQDKRLEQASGDVKQTQRDIQSAQQKKEALESQIEEATAKGQDTGALKKQLKAIEESLAKAQPQLAAQQQELSDAQSSHERCLDALETGRTAGEKFAAAQQEIRRNSSAPEARVGESVSTRTIGGIEVTTRTSRNVSGFGESGGPDAQVTKGRGRAGIMNDSTMAGPGWWGIGDTLAHAQAVGKQWSLGQNADGSLGVNTFSGTTTSNYDPTTAGVSIASGGEGTSKYNVNINAGANLLNAEARAYDMVYGGSTGSGTGVGGMIGAQARADIADEAMGINYQGGQADVQGKKIDNLVTASLSEQGAIGTQIDGDVGAAFGDKGAFLGGGAGAFAGAQVGGMASGSVDGVGAAAMGQAWAGIGAKATAQASYQHGKLNVDLGLGAALGAGGYVDLNLTLDLGQIANEIEAVVGAPRSNFALDGASYLASKTRSLMSDADYDAHHGKVGKAIGEGIAGVGAAVSTAVTGAAGVAIGEAETQGMKIYDGAGDLSRGMRQSAKDDWAKGDVKHRFEAMGEGIAAGAEEVGGAIKGLGEGAYDLVRDTGKALGSFSENVGKGVYKVGEAAFDATKSAETANLMDASRSEFKKGDFVGGIAAGATGVVTGAANLAEKVSNVGVTVTNAIGEETGKLGSDGIADMKKGDAKSVMKGIGEELGAAATGTLTAVSGVYTYGAKNISQIFNVADTINAEKGKSATEVYSDAGASFKQGSIVKGVEQGAVAAVKGAESWGDKLKHSHGFVDGAKNFFSGW